MKRISVVMATYNGAAFLAEQIDSILAQTVKAEEIIIVDDCSTDNTPDILQKYQQDYSAQIKVVENESNLGVNLNFEKATKLATGDFIFISDQDDIWSPEKIELMVGGIGEKSLIYSDGVIVDRNRNVISKSELRYHDVPAVEGAPLFYFIWCNSISGHNLLVKKDLLASAYPFHDGFFYDQWLGLVACLKDGIAYLDCPLVEHRLHEKNVLNNKRLFQKKKRKNHRERVEYFLEKQKKRQLLAEKVLEMGVPNTLLESRLQEYRDLLKRSYGRFFNWKMRAFLLKNRLLFLPGVSDKQFKKLIRKISRGDWYYRFYKLF